VVYSEEIQIILNKESQMEYTIILPDSPVLIADGSDGVFLSAFRASGNELWNVLQFPTSLPECRSQGTERKAAACPHRQTCYETLGEWYLRRGQYQRPDVTVHDRLDIARRFYAPERPWGEVSGMAREHDLSGDPSC
jgi:hypothetical protein